MIKIGKFSKNIITSLFKTRSYNPEILSEETKIIPSKLPFVGDRLEINGLSIATGPKSLARQFEKYGFDSWEYKKLINKFRNDKDLLTRISGEIASLPEQCFSSCNSKKKLFSNLDSLGNYAKNNPELLSQIKGYKYFLEEVLTHKVNLSTGSVLEEGVTDFNLITNMIKSLESSYFRDYRTLPEIARHMQGMPDADKIFDYCIKLTNNSEYTEKLCTYFFKDNILTSLGKESEGLGKFLEEIYKDSGNFDNLKLEFLEDLIKFGKKTNYSKWGKNFITEYISLLSNNKYPSIGIGEASKCVSNEEEARVFIRLFNSRTATAHSFKDFVELGLLGNKYQIEIYNYLQECKPEIANVLNKSDFRFSDIAIAKILKHVKTETDMKLVKAMVDRRSVRGDDLYDSFAIKQCLLQNEEIKLKILDKVSDSITIRDTLPKGIKGKILGHNGRYMKILESPFQQVIESFPENTSHEQLLKCIKPGNAAQVGKKMFVNDGQEIVELNIDKNTFEKLFISDKRGLCQGSVGDCGAISIIDSLLKTTKGKCSIYKLFYQEPGSNKVYIKFNNGECFYELDKIHNGVSAPPGIQMLEHALLKYRQSIGYRSLDSVSPVDVLYLLVGSGKYKSYNILCGQINIKTFKDIERYLLKLKNDNNFAILGSHDGIKESKAIIDPRHFHHVSGVNKFGRLLIENPHYSYRRDYSPLYETLDSRLIDSLDFFELI